MGTSIIENLPDLYIDIKDKQLVLDFQGVAIRLQCNAVEHPSIQKMFDQWIERQIALNPVP